ncbi:MAG: hypothetical protein KDD14_13045 [Saprospiraceae bacterium]|nr:hypothetical protein [Saprospiraceae bacterium]
MTKSSKNKRKSPQHRAASTQSSSTEAVRPPRPLLNLPAPWAFAIGLGIVGVVLVVLRWHLLEIPLERDESAYAYIGRQILEGKIPYRDIYEMKPPLLFYSYAALVAVFGYSLSGLHWAALFLTFWNAAWVMAVGNRILGQFYGFLAGLCYVLITANPFTCGILAESELVVMAFVMPGLYALLYWEQRFQSAENAPPARSWWLFAGGFLLACGTLVKQSAIFFFGLPALLLLLLFLKNKPFDWLRLLRQGAWVAAGTVVPVAICFGLMAALGAWDDFWFWNFKYVQTYASGLKQDLWAEAFRFNFSLLYDNFEVYWLLAGLGLAALLTKGLSGKHRLLLLGWLLVSFAAVAPGRRFYGHYWLQFFPAMAVVLAAFFYHLEKGLARLLPRLQVRPLVAAFTLLLLLFPIARYSPTLFRGDTHRLLRSMFPGNPYAEDKVLADFISKKMETGDEIAVLGSEPQYYVYLNKNAPSKHFYMAFLMRPIPESEGWQQEALDSLLAKNPRFVVFNFVEFSWMPKPNSTMLFYNDSYKFTRQNYRPIAWADLVSPTETKYVLDETQALNFKPSGSRYITVYERVEQSE